jgi:DNA-binding CsgD family transcriptional regulator
MRVANISKLLGVAPSTIRNHLKSIYRKWNVNSQPLKERAP